MELISRDEAIEMLQEAIDSSPPVMIGQGKTRDSTLEEAIDLIKDIPTIEERKEGRWVRITQDVGVGPHLYKCSECHRVIEYSSSELPCLLEMKFPYCHCGAKMKGE